MNRNPLFLARAGYFTTVDAGSAFALIITIMMSSSRTGKTEGPQRIGFQGDIRRRDGEA
jgi:hypothetical protein